MFSAHNSLYSKRNTLFTFSLLLILMLVVSACGASNNNKANDAATTAPAAQTDAPKDAAPEEPTVKTVKTANGDIEIPTHPKRIVAEEYLGSLIALEVIPVGAPGLTLENYYFKDSLTGVTDTGAYGQQNAEKIITLDPDLIITGNPDSYAALSKIAPTVVIPYGDLKNVHEELTYFGELLGVEDKAKAWLEKYDGRIAAAKAKVDAAIPAEASFAIMEDGGKSTWVYGDNFGRGGQPVYQALGRKPPAAVADEIMEKQWAEISTELLDQYAGDYVIMTSNTRTLEDFQADPIWSKLPAIKNGHFYVWPEARSWYYDPLAVVAQTEELAEWLVSQGK